MLTLLRERLGQIPLAAFRPRLVDALRDYDRARFLKDFAAGVTVGIVALPLAMAFGIASGVKPEQGLITAIVAGFLIAVLGGSNVQIGGPAGAFIVIVYGILQRYGLTNLLSPRRSPASCCSCSGCSSSARWCVSCRCRSSSASPMASRC